MISSLWKGRFSEENNKFHLSLQLILAIVKISFCRKTADAALVKKLQIHVHIRNCRRAFNSCNYHTLSERVIWTHQIWLWDRQQSPDSSAVRKTLVPHAGWGSARLGPLRIRAGPRLRWGTRVPQPHWPSRSAGKWRTLTGCTHVQVFKYSLLGTTGKPTIDISPWDVFSIAKKQ